MRLLLGTLLLSLLAALGLSAPAGADPLPPYPTNPFGEPTGANDWSCRPTAERPEPVILVHGTFGDRKSLLDDLSAAMVAEGFCVFSFDYGNRGTGDIPTSAKQLKRFTNKVRAATGADKVSMVGHSQGGMMPRYYMHLLGGAKKVDDLVGIAPSSHGTQGLIVALDGEIVTTASTVDNPACPACQDQLAGSEFMQTLNADGDTVRGPDYTVISTRYDEVVTPYESQFLDGPADQVTNILIQDKCPLDPIEHDQTPNDPVVHQLVLNALETDGPADPAFAPTCVPLG